MIRVVVKATALIYRKEKTMKTAFPQYKGTTEIRLYSNIPFDNTYANHSLISRKFKYNGSDVFTGSASLDACEMFINRKNPNITGRPYYYPRYDITGEFNFDYANGLLTSVVLELTSEQTNANYMRVKSWNNDGYEYYYYFITGVQQINVDTYRLSLELDVLMTYQDEFLEGMKDMPVFTDRKFCARVNSEGYPHCADYKSGDSVFGEVKPSIITNKYDLELSISPYLKGFIWAYVCCDKELPFNTDTPQTLLSMYKYKGTFHPLAMICFPVKFPENVSNLKLTFADDTTFVDFSNQDAFSLIDGLINDGKTHGVKLSPYPPFADSTMTINKVGGSVVIKSSRMLNKINYYEWHNDKTMLWELRGDISTDALVIREEYDSNNEYNVVDLDSHFNVGVLNPLSPRMTDLKLLFKPFRKYKVASAYSEGNEFFPELMFSDGVFDNAEFYFRTIATFYIGDNNLSTFVLPTTDTNGNTFYYGYQSDNVGLVSNVNYVIPSGTNALDVFNSTQAQAFYQSKTASGISAGLTIAGGVGSVALGVIGAVGSMGMSSVASAGLIVGGVGAIGSGIASLSNTIKSTNAKIEDLKNTPDSVNVGGNSYTTDMGRVDTLLPYVIVLECSEVIKERANDYFYQFGYEVARECYFNTELNNNTIDISKSVDTLIFNRDIFNYIKINDDITNKINANMPIIVKQKISNIFNKGITLWSWFGIDELWQTGEPAVNSNYWLDRWFLKCNLDNTECDFVLGV